MQIQAHIRNLRKNGKRSFTIKEIADELNVPQGHIRVAVSKLLKRGDLISPTKGFYVIIPPEYQPYGSIPAKELVPLMMQHLNASYYISLLTAGLFYGVTHQKPAKFQVISDKRIKHDLVFGDIEISFIYKKSISDLPTQKVVVNTGYLIVATPELMLLDLLAYPNHAGGLNHIATVLSELVESLNIINLISLAKNIRAEYQLHRIGYILDNIELMDTNKAEKFIEELALYVSNNKKNYIPLASEIPITGFPRCKKWRVVINTDIESDL